MPVEHPPSHWYLKATVRLKNFTPTQRGETPPQNFAIWDLSPAAAHANNAVRIAAVGAGGSAANSNVTWLGDSLTGQIMKNLVAPTFAGNNEDWPRFTLAWEKYWAKLGSHRKTSDFEKLELLESCLDEMNRRELQLMYKAAGGKQITFCEYWTEITTQIWGRYKWVRTQANEKTTIEYGVAN